MNPVSQYLTEIQKVLQSGDAREHAYRPAFQRLFESLLPDVQVINEPAYTGGNAPDFLFKRGGVPVSYAECKDVTVDVSDKEVQKQADRYVGAFGKILLTNYLEFRILDESGEIARVSIATLTGNSLEIQKEAFGQFENLIRDYVTPTSRTIRSAKRLAEIMASKARLLRDNSLAALKENTNSEIFAQYRAFKEVLIRELTTEEFADMYAQTLVYGLFVARYFDNSLENFSRHEAHDLLPSTNPLLKKFFGHVGGTDFDPKVAWMVDSLVEAYKSTDVRELMHREFERKQKDPILHFYETFLSEYDKDLRKGRGVYYTPEPVVSFIVRSVDQILKTKFNISKGLADTEKIEHEFSVQGVDGRTKNGSKKIKEFIHKVQILDPAVGTGTFLNEVIHEIYKTFKGQEGRWSQYVEHELLPRLHGFELMMASYTMAHLKLGVTLRELGYEGLKQRLSVWLTNSLEESVHEVPNLFMSQWLTAESNEASNIKSKTPVMVVIGNPPYSISSTNKGKYIQALISDYKKGLNERKINLDDDYIKFIRFAENAIEKTGYGIVSMITNNSFIDGVTHRQMRKHLMETFDEIYVLDLHGSSKKKEKAPDGTRDENVFAIQQGVSINCFIKSGRSKTSARVYHAELYGTQAYKFEQLNALSFDSVHWTELTLDQNYCFFVPKDFNSREEYESGFSTKELFDSNSAGVKTKVDNIAIDFDREILNSRVSEIIDSKYTKEEVISKFNLSPKTTWEYDKVSNITFNESRITKYDYRPFDTRYIYYDKDFLSRSRSKVMDHFYEKNNLGLELSRVGDYVFISDRISDEHFISDNSFKFPLYIYDSKDKKLPNLDKIIWQEITKVVGETAPEDVLDYVYAVLNSFVYRNKFKEFLKIDFPRVPYPKNKEIFWKLVSYGRELRELHLLTHPLIDKYTTTFLGSGSNLVEKKYPKYHNESVYINSLKHFGNVPKETWEFYVGGYQPAQKWLKDRRERVLTNEEIEHYQEIIVSINETIKVLKKIDSIL